MSVRWKPLLVLSGLFVVIAIIGLVAMAFSLVPKGKDILPLARAERTAKRYENAMLQDKRALQTDGKNASIHEEYAGMLADWMTVAPDGKRDEIRALWRDHLAAACNFDKTLKEPRKQLLAEAMKLDDSQESVRWANEVLSIDPNNLDAIYVLASEPLDVPSGTLGNIGGGTLAIRAAKGTRPVLKVEIKERKPFLSTRGDTPLRLEGITIEARYAAPDAKPEPAAEVLTAGTAEQLVQKLRDSVAQRVRIVMPPDAAAWLAANTNVKQPATRTCKAVLYDFAFYPRGIPAADKFCHGICDPRVPGAKPGR